MPGHRKFSELRRKDRPRVLPEPDLVWAWDDPGDAGDVATALRLLGISAWPSDAGWGTGEYVVQIRLNKALADALGLDIQERA